jgi:hypothetical protein
MLCGGDEGLSRSALGIACLAVALSFSAPASAGFLERLFGAFRHSHHAPRAPAVMQPFADPSGDFPMEREFGPAVGYCVRSCDGHYFPVHAQPRLSAAEACRSFCPAARTQVYSGRQHRHGYSRKRQPLCRPCQCLSLSQAGGTRLLMQRPRHLRPRPHGCKERSDAPAWRYCRNRKWFRRFYRRQEPGCLHAGQGLSRPFAARTRQSVGIEGVEVRWADGDNSLDQSSQNGRPQRPTRKIILLCSLA